MTPEELTPEALLDLIKTCHADVWEFRKEMGDRFPTPGLQHCLDFAVGEATEAIDPTIQGNTHYKRNNPRNATPHEELADTLFMALSALGEEFPDRITATYLSSRDRWGEVWRVRGIVWLLACACDAYDDGEEFWEEFLDNAILMLVMTPGMDVRAQLHGRLNNLRRKYSPSVFVGSVLTQGEL